MFEALVEQGVRRGRAIRVPGVTGTKNLVARSWFWIGVDVFMGVSPVCCAWADVSASCSAGKGSKQRVEIRGWPMLCVALHVAWESRALHGSTFIHKAADVALWLGQADCLGEGIQSLRLLLVHLVGQSLQEPDLNHMAPALALCRSLEHRLESLQGKSWLCCAKRTRAQCHLFAFAGKWCAMPLSQISAPQAQCVARSSSPQASQSLT